MLCFAAGVLDMHVRPGLFELPITSPSDLWPFYTGPVPGERVLWPGSAQATEGAVLDSPQFDVMQDAGRRSRSKSGVVDPGRRAGLKIPDEERDRRFRTKD